MAAVILERINPIVTFLTASCVILTRSVGVAYFAVGAVGCSVSVKLVKRLIRQPRPLHPVSRKKTYGMPSTHSAVITHFAVYIPLACRYLPMHPSFATLVSSRPFASAFANPERAFRLLAPLLAVSCAFTIVRSRIWLGHHTPWQCIVGCAYGALWAVGWFKLWTSGLDVVGREVEGFVNGILPF